MQSYRFCIGLIFFLVITSFQDVLGDRPNIVLIMADDSAADNYGCYGSDYFETPRLDALAKSGVRFTNCYSEPVCTASRVKIMTGRDNVRNYVAFGTLDKSELTFGTMLKTAGYATAVAGKWQLHGPPNGTLAKACGFENYCLWNYPGTERPRYWNPSIVKDGEPLELADDAYGPDVFTDYLIEFINQQTPDRPFFAYYPMVLTHSPFLTTPKSGIAKREGGGNALLNFRDMVAYADHCVGRIVDSLEAKGIRENTILIYTSDNGTDRSLKYPFQDEIRVGEKAYATEAGTHAPLIVNSPGRISGGRVVEDLIDFSDFLPTLAELAGAALPEVKLDGRSFVPQCLGQKGQPREYIFQYYYPKFRPASEKHGGGVNENEIIWAQTKEFKLYADGAFYRVDDRYEATPLPALGKAGKAAEQTRAMLRNVIDSMPSSGQKLRQAAIR
ncbi:sulfatase-like hydrolase/transferase [bacterium]|nr:sulfatase-like hydrolase/transferase [bacterium]